MSTKFAVAGRMAMGVVLTLATLPAALRAEPTTALLSGNGQPGGWRFRSGAEGVSESVFLSSDGRYAAFVTDARNLFDSHDVPRDTSAIALRDLQTGAVTPVSVGMNGAVPNGSSYAPTVTTDGRYVCFCSWASNLVANDTNNQGDVFVRDMQTGLTVRANVPYDGVWDENEKTYCLTHAMSDDGRYVVFTTASSHMAPGDNNDSDDVFLRDLTAGKTTLISVATAGGSANDSSIEPRIARNGRYVVWMSMATNLVSGTTTPGIRAYLRDTDTAVQKTTLIGDGGLPFITANGRYVAYSSLSMNGDDAQVYWADTQTGQRVLCSVAPNGTTPGNRDSLALALSDDGRTVCFVSKARNLVAGDTNDEADVFVRDLGATPAVTTRVSVAKDGLQGNRASGNGDMSADGRYIAFASASEDLVSLDINETWDVFVRAPMFAQSYSLSDALSAVRMASGREAATASGMGLDLVHTAPSTGRVDLLDAVRIARLAAGLN